MKRYIRSFLSIVPLSVLTASAVTAALTGLPWIVGLGFLGSGIIMWKSLRADKTEIIAGKRRPAYDVSKLDSERTKKFGAVLKKRREILEALDEIKDSPFLESDKIAERVENLVEGYYDLLVKLARIKPFLSRKAITLARRSESELKKRIARTSDEVTRRNLTMALRSKTDELHRLYSLKQYRKRLHSQLTNLLAALNSIYVRIVQFGLSAEESDYAMEELSGRINDLIVDVEISEKVARELKQVSEGTHVRTA
jgi:methyl-accepting chemotaxis protein